MHAKPLSSLPRGRLVVLVLILAVTQACMLFSTQKPDAQHPRCRMKSQHHDY